MRSWLFMLGIALAGCGDDGGEGAPTGAQCPNPDPGTLTYDNFGMQFMSSYCTMCHDSALTGAERNGAPAFHDFDTLLGILDVEDHIDEQAGFGPDAQNTLMPPTRCPSSIGGPLDTNCAKPSDDERRKLAEWLACERGRPH
ncbi:MAG TPA: hypothetical protein VFQ53_22285 [Kofleriaceae bacterium]|nr:hypothetical protein [Kofleriaceae bacterium]